jgi:hypothetical protein
MRKLGLLLLTAILAAPLASRADGSIQIDLGAAVAKPFGQVASGTNLGDQVAWGFPLQADVQFRFLKSFAAGPYIRYAPTSLGSPLQTACSGSGVSCDASDLSFGALGEYRFSDRLEGGPWLGALVGWEMLKATAASTVPGSTTLQKATVTSSGLQLGVRAGMDFELGGITLGPWAAFQAAQFSSYQADSGGTSRSGSISDQALHGWFEVGVRLSLLL